MGYLTENNLIPTIYNLVVLLFQMSCLINLIHYLNFRNQLHGWNQTRDKPFKIRACQQK